MRRLGRSALALALVAGCSSEANSNATSTPAASTTTMTDTATASSPATAAPATHAPTTAPVTSPPTTAPSTTAAPTTTSITIAPSTTVAVADVRHVFPVQDAANTSFGETHAGYPATDVFHSAGCGATIVSPVDGVILEVRRDNVWDPSVDDPDTRGGRTVAVLGDDGVRYYLAHFQRIDDSVQDGVRVSAGDPLGELGESGRTSACHLHFGLSPVCPNDEWWVRRGVIWPYPYLRDWRNGVNTSPHDEIDAWVVAHPDGCATPPTTA